MTVHAKRDGTTRTWTFCDSALSARRVGDQPTTRAHFQDDRHGMAAVIRIDARNPGTLDVSVTFVHAKRDNRALAEAARLYAMILDTYEDLLADPREDVLEIDRPVLDGVDVSIVGRDALAALYGFFGDAIEEVV